MAIRYDDVKILVKHLANGNLSENHCIVCLSPLSKTYENIFTKICKEDNEYCIADVLHELCKIEFTDRDNYNVCIDCFMSASNAYKFYLTAKRSEEILNFYTEKLVRDIDFHKFNENPGNTLCILPLLEPSTPLFDYDLNGIGVNENNIDIIQPNTMDIKLEPKTEPLDDQVGDDVVIIIDELGRKEFYRVKGDAILPLEETDMKHTFPDITENKEKQRRKRDPMTFKSCTECPVRYRFVSKLREHMKTAHAMELYICKVCKATTTNLQEHEAHKKTHSGVHECQICNTVYKKCDTIMSHMKWHEEMENVSQNDGAFICEVCGVVLESADKLQEHNEKKHLKKYTCYYCGRMYRGEVNFEMHIKKHEMVNGQLDKPDDSQSGLVKKQEKRRCMCATCGRYFVDERSLLWHQRLHTDERPYSCNVCGRGFVSAARRNQHSLCAHTPPARRCPLCPALFHLRSMVNTHIKKVHLKTHKRRYRSSKQRAVCWRTESVPIEELSVAVQGHILDLKARGGEQT